MDYFIAHKDPKPRQRREEDVGIGLSLTVTMSSRLRCALASELLNVELPSNTGT